MSGGYRDRKKKHIIDMSGPLIVNMEVPKDHSGDVIVQASPNLIEEAKGHQYNPKLKTRIHTDPRINLY